MLGPKKNPTLSVAGLGKIVFMDWRL